MQAHKTKWGASWPKGLGTGESHGSQTWANWNSEVGTNKKNGGKGKVRGRNFFKGGPGQKKKGACKNKGVIEEETFHQWEISHPARGSPSVTEKWKYKRRGGKQKAPTQR